MADKETEAMTQEKALSIVSDGHGMISVETAKEVCAFFGVKFEDWLVMRWSGQKDANPGNDPKGLFLYEDKPGEGVPTLRLSRLVVEGLGGQVGNFLGRGFEARDNARQIKEAKGW